MKISKYAALAVCIHIISTAYVIPGTISNRVDREKLEQASDLFERGMFERAGAIYSSVSGDDDLWKEGCRVLSAASISAAGYETMMDSYFRRFPYSSLIPQIRYVHSANLFRRGDYAGASVQLEQIGVKRLYRRQIPGFLFRRAYCDYRNGETVRAKERFRELAGKQNTDYTAPAEYYLGYMNYQESEFREAALWFSKSASDARFRDLSNYYILECRFMEKDYAYVVDKGPGLLETVPEDRKAQLSRIISESYLVLGNVSSADKFYVGGGASSRNSDRTDYFYAGSLKYALGDWHGAIDNFSLMSDRTDSLGQAANCRLAFSYIRTGNKVAAMEAFKEASKVDFDPALTEDAFYNYAKLAFDLNKDISVFEDYLKRYSDRKRGDRIYAYIAMGALASRDYAAAVEAYDKIDVLDRDMQSNYMKANYLRAEELISGGSWRSAVPCLKAAAYYSDRRGAFNQLSRYWLAESYFRSGDYVRASEVLTDLYNTSALYGSEESTLIPYNMAYCHFMSGNYDAAYKWFSEYVKGNAGSRRKEALVRMGDCLFMKGDYREAGTVYGRAAAEYRDVNDIYPYYKEAVCLGLLSETDRKIEILRPVLQADPSSDFYPDALYELGIAYSRNGQESPAGECFRKLTSSVKDTSYIAMSLLELGTMARKASRADDALKYYRRVVELMPVSEYAESALMAIEAVFQSQNDPEGYLAYIESIGRGGSKTAAEKELMFFNAAEQAYLAGNRQKALSSLTSYIEKYPDGSRVPLARFYLGESYRQAGRLQDACDNYSKALACSEGSVREMSLLRYSELSFGLQKYDDAYSGYSELYDKALIPANRSSAAVGMMRSASQARKYHETLRATGLVLGDSGTDDAVRNEAVYIKAKSLLAVSRRDEAMDIFRDLAKNPSTEYGAESAFILIQDCYDRGDFKKVEEMVYAFSDSGSTRQYWLAKAFVVLGDVFVETGELEQAKATFESVRDGYNPQKPDDVRDNVEMRLRKLAELMSPSTAREE